MSISNSSDSAIAQIPSYPSFEELHRLHKLQTHPVVFNTPAGEQTFWIPHAGPVVSKSSAMERILWTLDSPFPDAISVMKDKHSPTSLTPFFSDGTWHPISQEPISQPKVSAITVTVDEIQQWEYLWTEEHSEHGEMGIAQEGRWYGDLEDYNPGEDSDREGEEHLLGCCGEPRPRKRKEKMVVQAGSRGFVTVYDYLSTLHPWVMGLKEGIITSNALWDHHWSEMVVWGSLDSLSVDEKADWVRHKSHMPNPVPVVANGGFWNPYATPGTFMAAPEFGPENRKPESDMAEGFGTEKGFAWL